MPYRKEPYRKENVYEPYTMDDEQDMWVGTVTCTTPLHTECIEVRAETEILLNARISVILAALNDPSGLPS